MTELAAIDPDGCGCTDCLVGESVPLQRATANQIRRLIRGELVNRTGVTFTRSVCVSADGTGYTWITEES